MTTYHLTQRSAELPLRVLLYSSLLNAITWNFQIVPVYDAPPGGTPEPFIAIGDCQRDELELEEVKSSYFERYTLNILIVTDYGGRLENVYIKNAVIERLSSLWGAGTLQFAEDVGFCIREFSQPQDKTEGKMGVEVLREDALEIGTLVTVFKISQES